MSTLVHEMTHYFKTKDTAKSKDPYDNLTVAYLLKDHLPEEGAGSLYKALKDLEDYNLKPRQMGTTMENARMALPQRRAMAASRKGPFGDNPDIADFLESNPYTINKTQAPRLDIYSKVAAEEALAYTAQHGESETVDPILRALSAALKIKPN